MGKLGRTWVQGLMLGLGQTSSPPSPSFVTQDKEAQTSRIFVEPNSLMLSSARPRCRSFGGSTAGGLGWASHEVKALPLAWFSGLALLLNMVESTAVWPQGLLDAKIAVIQKVDADSTSLGQRPLCVRPVS